MISKERLEELIEQCETIFSNEYGEIQLIKENDLILYANGHNNYILYILEPNKKYHYEIFDEDLFETLEEAEWHKEFGCIEKPQYLKFPNWKQIENYIENMRKFGLNHSDRVLARIITSDSIYYFKLHKDLDIFMFQLKQTYIGDDLCEQLSNRFPLTLSRATKENYILACRKCKELFLGD